MLNRQVAAEAKLMAEMYCGLNREAQIAMMANMEGMARAFPDLDRSVEVAQPLPRNPLPRRISTPPGMPKSSGAVVPARSKKSREWPVRNGFVTYATKLTSKPAQYDPDVYFNSGGNFYMVQSKSYSNGK